MAKAAGYEPVTPTGQRILHYINPSIYRQGHLLDPTAVPVLVYVNTAHGAVLSAAMYLIPQGDDATATGRMSDPVAPPHRSLLQCRDGGRQRQCRSCSTGVNQVTAPMMHVWVTPVAGGPFAPDPPAVSTRCRQL